MTLVATQVKRRRGTTAENDAFTGAEGEITVDTEKHELRVHDGLTQGGFKIPTAESLDFASKSLDNLSSNGEARFTVKVDKGHELIDFQIPTSANGFTWYRKYADGWVEQGGQATISAQNANAQLNTTVNLPITMANQTYNVNVCFITDGGFTTGLRNNANNRNTTTLVISTYSTTQIANSYIVTWEIKGMAQ